MPSGEKFRTFLHHASDARCFSWERTTDCGNLQCRLGITSKAKAGRPSSLRRGEWRPSQDFNIYCC